MHISEERAATEGRPYNYPSAFLRSPHRFSWLICRSCQIASSIDWKMFGIGENLFRSRVIRYRSWRDPIRVSSKPKSYLRTFTQEFQVPR